MNGKLSEAKSASVLALAYITKFGELPFDAIGRDFVEGGMTAAQIRRAIVLMSEALRSGRRISADAAKECVPVRLDGAVY
jgi:hypothetical protein